MNMGYGLTIGMESPLGVASCFKLLLVEALLEVPLMVVVSVFTSSQGTPDSVIWFSWFSLSMLMDVVRGVLAFVAATSTNFTTLCDFLLFKGIPLDIVCSFCF